MSEEQAIPVTIKILDKEYKLACKPDEEEGLVMSAQYLDAKLREMRQRTSGLNSDRLAIVTALNITHELIQLRRDVHQLSRLEDSLAEIEGTIVQALSSADND